MEETQNQSVGQKMLTEATGVILDKMKKAHRITGWLLAVMVAAIIAQFVSLIFDLGLGSWGIPVIVYWLAFLGNLMFVQPTMERANGELDGFFDGYRMALKVQLAEAQEEARLKSEEVAAKGQEQVPAAAA